MGQIYYYGSTMRLWYYYGVVASDQSELMMNGRQKWSVGERIVLFISTVSGIVAGSFLVMAVL